MGLIVRDELIRLINAEKAKYNSANYKQIRRGLCKAIRIAYEMDGVDAEPVRHGRWDANGRCTNCGGHAPYWAMATTYYKSPYCFECGAKMDLEVQDDTD